MNKLLKYLCLAFVLIISGIGFSQDEETVEKEQKWREKFNLNGYVKYMNTNTFQNLDSIYTDNLFHNRLNFKYYPNNNITFSLEVRNRLFYGESVKSIPFYADYIGTDIGEVDLSFNLIETNSLILNSTIDRANFEFNKGKWNVRIGRQRINWGINMAWNPNDLFNAYNFVDFDYQERPGTDAIRIQYYNKPMSQIELAYKPGKDLDNSIIAGLYRFNKKGYDFQIIGANYLSDFTLGTGWAGNIKNIGFKGEASYFHPKQNLADTSGVFVSSVSFDYTFDQGIYINLSGFYNSGATTGINFTQALSSTSNLTAKNLLPTEFAAFVQVSGSFTPIFGGGLSTMYLPDIQGIFLMPSLYYSILENWDLDFTGQILFAQYPNKFQNLSNALFMRLRWSF